MHCAHRRSVRDAVVAEAVADFRRVGVATTLSLCLGTVDVCVLALSLDGCGGDLVLSLCTAERLDGLCRCLCSSTSFPIVRPGTLFEAETIELTRSSHYVPAPSLAPSTTCRSLREGWLLVSVARRRVSTTRADLQLAWKRRSNEARAFRFDLSFCRPTRVSACRSCWSCYSTVL